ncbi:MAG: molybdopterin-dependent oxidoreductase [Gammaproteobacteria bacterium]|nr:molybdopterin-dependent oxidoreductase [Gammaproteobacteria bacterium]NIO26645.1 molybdopterin-dependent oxidoreductase [Gammaproteobacteria bacterium]NIO67198.1 molybdopterin-dependent oxidoreductase [Gammaproteobacteria bacterium]NIP66352.1 molybdopterin-dependent oxidoreductase [Gammaproteobacteria bacterium]NIQ28478.1 molybdopterin-dependent oxidoreductase [Gammaproteobacteria bacterium]
MPRASAVARVHSACPHDCPSTCALEVERIDAHTIGRVYGAKDNDYTAGVICAKVARYAERVHHPDRLREPLRRSGAKGVGISAFEPLSWDDALDEVAEKLLQAEQRHGSETVWPYFYAGTMGLVQRDGIERLRHVKRYSRQHSTFCITLVDAGWIAGTGAKRGVDPREMAESDLIVVWGANPVNTQVNVMHHVAQAKRERGAKLVVVDPYRTGTAEKAHIHLMPRPGTDGALACGVMHVLFAEGFADRDYLARYTDVPEALEAHLETRTPEWASRLSGVPAEKIVEFARLYGNTERSFLRIGYGMSRSRNGAANVHAVSCLPAVTGAWRHRGGGALYSNHFIYGIDQTVIMGLDARDKSVRVLDQARIGPVLCGDPADLQGGPPVTAMFIQNTNPMMVAPQSLDVRKGFSRSDLFTCVHEQFMTETAAMADIVLPATTFLEHDDMYQGGGHTYFQVTRKVIEPYAESRPNHWVLCELAKRVGAKHPGFEMSEWQLIEDALRRSSRPDAESLHAAHWHDCAMDFETMHYLNGFANEDGRFHFSPDWALRGPNHECMTTLPDHLPVIDEADDEHPFRMVTAPARNYLNSTFTETPTSIASEGRPTVLVHPEDMREIGIEAGDRVRIGNRRASVVVHAKVFDGVQQGVVVVESIWPNHAFEEGIGINALVSAEPGAPNGGAVYHDTAVWLRPA